MSFDFVTTAVEADEMLREFGAEVVVTWTPAPATDDPEAVPPAAVTKTAYGVVLDYSQHKVGTQPDSLIRAGDRNLLLSALQSDGQAMPEVPPEAVVDAAGSRYVIRNNAALAPAGVMVLQDITVRR